MIIHANSPILVTHENLEIVNQDLINRWKKIPYAANSQEIADQAREILARFNKSELSKPSILAGISPTIRSKSDFIILIDNAYMTAMNDYEDSLIIATAKDFNNSNNTRNTALDFHRALATGGVRFLKNNTNIPVLKWIIGPLLVFLGNIYGIFYQNKITAEEISIERSVHRNKWFDEVKVKEEIRINRAANLIQQRANKLQKDIKDLAEKGFESEDLNDELKALSQLYCFLLPGKTLQLNGMSVLQYLESFNQNLIE